MEFETENLQQMAGLIFYYNGSKFHCLYVSCEQPRMPCLRVTSCLLDLGRAEDIGSAIPIPAGEAIELRAEVDFERLHFGYRAAGEEWRWMPQQLDAGPPFQPNFTGAFVGICCQDLAGTLRPADFEFFEYQEREYRAARPA